MRGEETLRERVTYLPTYTALLSLAKTWATLFRISAELEGKPTAPPEELLAETLRELRSAKFSFEADRFTSQERMLDFEWVVKTSLAQAEVWR